MTRTYSQFSDTQVKDLLSTLIQNDLDEFLYREIMYQIGKKLGEKISSILSDKTTSICLACTVEDADFLAKGILNTLEKSVEKVSFTCFWNKRFSPFEMEEVKIAPILRKYQEPCEKGTTVIVVKSIISGACVVKTNLTDLIDKINPHQILIAAPVIHNQSQEKLKDEFDEQTYSKFQFIFFAEDSERDAKGEVKPGVGGDVYKRLGFENQEGKNKYTPLIVRERRTAA